MSNYLTYQAAGLLFRNAGLSRCCCGTREGLYWEGIPCPLNFDPKQACYEFDTCQMDARTYFKNTSYCAGTDVKICECQRLKINGFNSVVEGSMPDVLTFTYNGVALTTGSVTLSGNTLTLTATGYPNIVIDVSQFATLTLLFDELIAQNVNHASAWSFNRTLNNLNPIDLADKTFTLTPGNTDGLDTETAGIYFSFEDQPIFFAPFHPDPDQFVLNLAASIPIDVGFVNVFKNEWYTGGALFWAEIKFTGNDCGIPQSPITIERVVGPDFVEIAMYYGDDPEFSYMNPSASTKEYFVIGGNEECPLERTAPGAPYTNPDIGCCPQKGVTLGPYQHIVSSTGYFRSDTWSNLESTIKWNNSCYSLSPGFFVAGMEGRLQYNEPFDKELHQVTTDYTDCVRELFIPLFHANVPWGPFGAYFPGVEYQIHPAWLEPYSTNANPLTDGYRAFLSSGDAANFPRDGYTYRPYAEIRTKGEWLATKEIKVVGRVYKPIPYHVGDAPFDDASGTIQFDPVSISSDISVTYPGGAGCGDFVIAFDCSGKTIGQFLTAINNLKISGVDDCKVFNFCPGSSEALSVPASEIINVSSEIADHNIATYGNLVGDPDSDGELLSGAHVIMPKGYQYYFGNSIWNQERFGAIGNGFPVIYYGETLLPLKNQAAASPPECRITRQSLPKDGGYPILSAGNKHWFTNINTVTQVTAGISLNQNIDPTGYPNWSIAQILPTTGRVYYYASGRAILSGYFNTLQGGSGYTNSNFADDVNALSFTWASGTFNPFVATGLGPYTVWYDDQTSFVTGVYAYSTVAPTEYNYSYKEPTISGAVQNLLTGSGYIRNTCRRRCLYGTPPFVTGDPIYPYCLSSAATVVEGSELDCAGDDYVVGSWLLGFGCYSNSCITRWYYKTERCGCDMVWRCNDNGPVEVPHPFNQPENNLNNATYANLPNDISVSQPTLYICEHNFHSECDIPMMVKVPFQVTNNLGLLDYQNGTVVDLPAASEFCDPLNPWPSNAYGWCQYIDPVSALRVRQEDIPRTDPPTAYVVERTRGSFCSTNVWNFDPHSIQPGTVPSAISFGATALLLPDGCSSDSEACGPFDPICASCDAWDRMCNIYALGDDYLIRYSDPSYLCALFRPIVQNLEYRDVCGGVGLDRLDIDCSTTCCECGFVCAIEGGPAVSKVGNSWTQTLTYSNELTYTTPVLCGWDSGDYACGVLIGCCLVDPSNLPCQPSQYCFGPPCVADCGTFTITTNISFEKTLSNCGCYPAEDVCVTETVTGSLGGGGTGPCPTTVLVAGDLPTPQTICYGCSNISLPDPTPYTIDDDSGFLPAPGCGGCGGRPQVYSLFQRVQRDVTSGGSITSDDCTGAYNYTYSYAETNITTYSGDNSCSASPVTVTATQNQEINYVLTAKSWQGCNYPTIPGQTYEYIQNWKSNNLQYICGEVGLALGVSGVADPRHIGGYCGV